MYSTVGQYLGDDETPPVSHLSRETYVYHPSHGSMATTASQPRSSSWAEKYTPIHQSVYNHQNIQQQAQGYKTGGAELTWKTEYIKNTADPKVWGPAFWFTLHTSAAHYPMKASPLVKERMKARILAIPYEVPCKSCQGHASAFVEKHREQLDHIVSGRHELGRFWVKMHNYVNKRFGKPEWTYEDAYKMYAGGANVRYLQ